MEPSEHKDVHSIGTYSRMYDKLGDADAHAGAAGKPLHTASVPTSASEHAGFASEQAPQEMHSITMSSGSEAKGGAAVSESAAKQQPGGDLVGSTGSATTAPSD